MYTDVITEYVMYTGGGGSPAGETDTSLYINYYYVNVTCVFLTRVTLLGGENEGYYRGITTPALLPGNPGCCLHSPIEC